MISEAKLVSDGWMRADFSMKLLFPDSDLYRKIREGKNGFWKTLYEYTKVYFYETNDIYVTLVVACGERTVFIFKDRESGELLVLEETVSVNRTQRVADWEVTLRRPTGDPIFGVEVIRYDPVAKLEAGLRGEGIRVAELHNELQSSMIQTARAVLHEVAYHRHPNYRDALLISRDDGRTVNAEYRGSVLEAKQVVTEVACKYCTAR